MVYGDFLERARIELKAEKGKRAVAELKERIEEIEAAEKVLAELRESYEEKLEEAIE